MPWSSQWKVDIPNVDLPTYVFPYQSEFLGNRPLLLDADRPTRYHLTHTTYRDWSKRFAAGLIKNGFKPGDRLLLYSGNTIFFPVVLMGTIMAGGIFSGANPGYVDREVAYQLKDTGATFLITADQSLDIALRAADSINFPRDQVFIFDDGYATFDGLGRGREGIRHWSHLHASSEEGRAFRWQALTAPDELNRTICLNYSSGTTGVPKGVEIAHRNYVANTAQVIFNMQQSESHVVKALKAAWLCALPMYHAYGQTYFSVTSIVRQTPVFVMRKYDFVRMLEHIQTYHITTLNLVPPLAVALAKSPLTRNYDLTSVEQCGCGAAPLGGDVARELEGLLKPGVVNVKQGWGMTEVTCSMTSWHPDDWATTNAVGVLNANCEAKLVDEETGEEVPRGERGEFLVRGPNVMKGYWNKPEATAETFAPDGWLKTGDIAHVNEEGHVFIVDRKKELIKVKGNQVAPAELEGLLLDIDEIADAAVIGVIINGEELPRAYVVIKEGRKMEAKEIQSKLAARVAKHKRLAGGVVFTESIPKNPSGKILRKILRDQAKAEIGDSEARQSKL